MKLTCPILFKKAIQVGLLSTMLIVCSSGPTALASDLESFSYHPNFLTSQEQVKLTEHWKAMDFQAARSRSMIEQAQKSCNQAAFQMEMEGLKSHILQMMTSLKQEYPEQAKYIESEMKYARQIHPLLEKTHMPQADMVQFHLYFYNRFLNEAESVDGGCIAAGPNLSIQPAVPTFTKDQLQQETIQTLSQVHKMTTYMGEVIPLVKKCEQEQYHTYLDPLEQLSERILVLRKEAMAYSGQSNDDSIYGLLDRLFDEVMTMRRQMEHAWQEGQCIQSARVE